VVTAGMVSTTWVQFLKGALLVIFSTVLVALILNRGVSLTPQEGAHEFLTLGPYSEEEITSAAAGDLGADNVEIVPGKVSGVRFIRATSGEEEPRFFSIVEEAEGRFYAQEAQTVRTDELGRTLVNGQVKGT